MTKLHRGYTQEDVEKLAAIVREADNWLNIEDECMELAKAAGLEDEWSAAPEEAYNDWALACMGDADYVEFIDSAH